MQELACPLAEHLIRPRDEPPLLSVVIPNKDRVNELAVAATSIAEQLVGGLERKVEIIIADNASGPEVAEVVRALAARHQTISYLIHQRDEMGLFQLFAAPWRARGRFTWVFGSDDAMLPGGIAAVVEALERDDPYFLTMNKRAWNSDFTAEIWEAANTVPDRIFPTFVELFCAIGLNQVAFISANVERTETCRTMDWDLFLRADTRHPHVGAYLEKFHDKRSSYLAHNGLVHRLGNSLLEDYNGGNFFDYATALPALLTTVLERIGGPPDLFERMTGEKRIGSYAPSGLTFVDSIFENALRAIGSGYTLNSVHRYVIERALSLARPDRMAQFEQIWNYNRRVVAAQNSAKDGAARLDQMRALGMKASLAFTEPTGAHVDARSAAAA